MSTATAVPDTKVDDASAPARPRRKLLLALSALVVLVAGGGGAWWFLGGTADADEVVERAEGELVAVEPLTISLADSTSYARIGFSLVLFEGADADAVQARLPLVRDAAISRVAATPASELRSVEGMDRLRADLAAAANEQVGPDVVARVVLSELVVQ